MPFLVSVFTFIFLYWAWFLVSPTQTRTFNEDKGSFYNDTGKDLPMGIYDVKEFDNTSDSWFGDGDTEISFQIDKTNLQQWMAQSGYQWKKGPFDKSGETLNEFNDDGSLIFNDSSDIEYVVINRTPKDKDSGQPSAGVFNTTTIFSNPKEGWVLIADRDI